MFPFARHNPAVTVKQFRDVFYADVELWNLFNVLQNSLLLHRNKVKFISILSVNRLYRRILLLWINEPKTILNSHMFLRQKWWYIIHEITVTVQQSVSVLLELLMSKLPFVVSVQSAESCWTQLYLPTRTYPSLAPVSVWCNIDLHQLQTLSPIFSFVRNINKENTVYQELIVYQEAVVFS